MNLFIKKLFMILLISFIAAAAGVLKTDFSYARSGVLDGAKIKEALRKSEAAYLKNKKILSELSDKSNDDISFVKKAYMLLLKKEASDRELTERG